MLILENYEFLQNNLTDFTPIYKIILSLKINISIKTLKFSNFFRKFQNLISIILLFDLK